MTKKDLVLENFVPNSRSFHTELQHLRGGGRGGGGGGSNRGSSGSGGSGVGSGGGTPHRPSPKAFAASRAMLPFPPPISRTLSCRQFGPGFVRLALCRWWASSVMRLRCRHVFIVGWPAGCVTPSRAGMYPTAESPTASSVDAMAGLSSLAMASAAGSVGNISDGWKNRNIGSCIIARRKRGGSAAACLLGGCSLAGGGRMHSGADGRHLAEALEDLVQRDAGLCVPGCCGLDHRLLAPVECVDVFIVIKPEPKDLCHRGRFLPQPESCLQPG